MEKAIEQEHLLEDEQQGFRADRSCHSAALIMDILKQRRLREKKPFHAAYLDISKAYDTVNHKKLFEILEAKGFQGQFLENIKELYSNNRLRTLIPEGKMKGVFMKRSIRQGCPLLPLLFAVYVDEVAIAMKQINRTQKSQQCYYMQMTW